ncbi:hypothetical protein OSTOST_15336 [Ostertagia ostertagi]
MPPALRLLLTESKSSQNCYSQRITSRRCIERVITEAVDVAMRAVADGDQFLGKFDSESSSESESSSVNTSSDRSQTSSTTDDD